MTPLYVRLHDEPEPGEHGDHGVATRTFNAQEYDIAITEHWLMLTHKRTGKAWTVPANAVRFIRWDTTPAKVEAVKPEPKPAPKAKR